MVDMLDDFITPMEEAEMDVDHINRFTDVGEWPLALEGIYAAYTQNPGMFDAVKVDSLVAYFGLDQEDIDEIAQGSDWAIHRANMISDSRVFFAQ